uniref:Uncharacterized protein n=1 Tax=Timema tahoe TaxID=61484 RepID=A0A7R9IH29_9NEOP|nr:unnamed protein product [Timema tahoe]
MPSQFELKTPLCSSEKPTGGGSPRAVHKQFVRRSKPRPNHENLQLAMIVVRLMTPGSCHTNRMSHEPFATGHNTDVDLAGGESHVTNAHHTLAVNTATVTAPRGNVSVIPTGAGFFVTKACWSLYQIHDVTCNGGVNDSLKRRP